MQVAWKYANISIGRFGIILSRFVCNRYTFYSDSELPRCSHTGLPFISEEQKKVGTWHNWYFCHTCQPCSWCPHNAKTQDGSSQNCVFITQMLIFNEPDCNRLKNCSDSVCVSVFIISFNRIHDASLLGVPLKTQFCLEELILIFSGQPLCLLRAFTVSMETYTLGHQTDQKTWQ